MCNVFLSWNLLRGHEEMVLKRRGVAGKWKKCRYENCFSEWWPCVAWSLGNLCVSKDTTTFSPWSRGWREQILGSRAGIQQLSTIWCSQLLLKEQPESADQIRKVYKIFFLCDRAGVWALIKRWSWPSCMRGSSSRSHHRAPKHSGRCKAHARDLGIAGTTWFTCGPFVRLSTLVKIKFKPWRERPQLQVCWTHFVALVKWTSVPFARKAELVQH